MYQPLNKMYVTTQYLSWITMDHTVMAEFEMIMLFCSNKQLFIKILKYHQ